MHSGFVGAPELVEVNICEKIINNIKAERYNTQLRKMRSVNINCLVLGMPFRNIISIKIKENETIGELKRRIKAENDYFETAGASDLRLWRTNTRIGSSNAIPSFDLSDSNEILSYFQIKDIWKEDPPNLHIVVKIEERNVGELKSMIKKRWKPLFSHIVSNELKLMAINVPPNQVIAYEEDKCLMKNLDKIKSVFTNSIYNYNFDHLHVMISSNTWKSEPKFISSYFMEENKCGPIFLKQKINEIKVKYIDINCNEDECICKDKKLKKSEYNLKYAYLNPTKDLETNSVQRKESSTRDSTSI
ncbi:hypothetical protein RhiirA4_511745 [Rhizophagus irregularis]|uniref:Crinkler family protein n=3 Tax=Rhizophagus irregularis TaxID=588596 RepID=A0A2I1HGZ4_9GLOM|nr:hypothetical protein RhiirA4_511745 [Rhizophagus irregularis]